MARGYTHTQYINAIKIMNFEGIFILECLLSISIDAKYNLIRKHCLYFTYFLFKCFFYIYVYK